MQKLLWFKGDGDKIEVLLFRGGGVKIMPENLPTNVVLH